MPSVGQQLSAHRSLTALRTIVRCRAKASALREGPAAGDGPGAAWLAFLCPAHSEGLPEWPGTASHDDSDWMPCGTVLDFRPTEQLLQSHADLWLTALTGVRPERYGGVWVLEEGDRVLRERLEEDGDSDEGGPLQGIVTMMWLACRSAAEGDLMQAVTALAYCETLAQGLESRRDGDLAPQ
ncbi:hypothetical protein ABTY98_41985 [Streptomyces sp. NPDC096040]|uniref:hypothetical protein n=1 Tax=Streptomyces sp. NPDC096040 TaxID=3155541 RepID=UPI00331F77BE